MSQQTVAVHAAEPWNHTGIQLIAGRRYSMTATGEWFDRGLRYSPDGGPAQSVFQKILEWARRRSAEPWFVLTGAVDENGSTAFRIGSSLENYVAVASGELTCYANDVRFAYGNNSGSVILTVRQVR